MRLRIFQAREGDALLLSQDAPSAQGSVWTHVLVDGGRMKAYREHIRSHLSALETSPGEDAPSLDLVVVSHIDQDHIEGVLRYVDDLVAWRVFRHLQAQAVSDPHLAAELAKAKNRPEAAQPLPEPRDVWHNAFHEVVGDNAGAVSDMLAALAVRAGGSEAEEAGEKQAHHFSRRIGPEGLGLRLNHPAGGRLMMVRAGQGAIDVGSLEVTVLGPTAEELEELRDEWNVWLATATDDLTEVRERAERVHRSLEDPDLDGVAVAVAAHASPLDDAAFLTALAEASGVDPLRATELGKAGAVTWPNRASLMLLVEVGGIRVVLTGDGHHARLLQGLENAGVLAPGTPGHVDVLKIPHHGSKNNADEAFFRRLIADHYVFCADGSHHNPHLDIVRALFASRLSADVAERSSHPRAGDPFTVWFATHPTQPFMATRDVGRAHLEDVVEEVGTLVGGHPHVTIRWSDGDFLDLELESEPDLTLGHPFIARVLPNPVGADRGAEWVELRNPSPEAVELGALHLEDRQGGAVGLAGTLAPGAVRRIHLGGGAAIRLANSGDEVKLMRGAEVLDRVEWTHAASGRILEFPAG